MSQLATVAAVPPATSKIRSAPVSAVFFTWPSLSLKKSNSYPPRHRPRPRRRLPSVRLGGRKKRGVRSTLFIVRKALKRLKLRWLRLRYARMLKKLRALYASVVQDLAESGAALDALQKRILLETFYTVPIMPMSVTSSVPSHVHKLND